MYQYFIFYYTSLNTQGLYINDPVLIYLQTKR